MHFTSSDEEKICFAKKLVLPSNAANVIQSLNMACAFEKNQITTFFYPCAQSKDDLEKSLKKLSLNDQSLKNWDITFSNRKVLYSILFRQKILSQFLSQNKTYFYARDLSEANFIKKLIYFSMFLKPDLLKRKPLFYEMHEILYEQHKENKKYNWAKTKKREEELLKSVNGIIFTNESLKNDVSARYKLNKNYCVEPNGYNHEIFKKLSLFTEENPWPAAASRIKILYFGRIIKGKGALELLKAFKYLPQNYSLLLVGGGDKKEIEELEKVIPTIEAGSERIKMTGQISQEEIPDHCAKGHIFVLPQQDEKDFFSPLKLNEYLAMGFPVVATPVKAFDCIKDNLFFAKDKSAQGIAQAIKELVSMPNKAEELRLRGLIKAKNHTWVARASRIIDFMRNS